MRSFAAASRCLLGLLANFIISVGVAGINLYYIVQQAHHHDFCNVDGFVGVFFQQVCHNGHMPGMFRIIFLSAVVGEVGLPENIFFLVDF